MLLTQCLANHINQRNVRAALVVKEGRSNARIVAGNYAQSSRLNQIEPEICAAHISFEGSISLDLERFGLFQARN